MNATSEMEKGGSITHGNVEYLPQFTRQLKDLRCCDGDAVTLECQVHGIPEPIIIWEKDGRVLPPNADFDTSIVDDKAILSIKRIYFEDEGVYTCIATNTIGRSFTSACIIVDVPEEKENLISRQLIKPCAFLSSASTPYSTPRTTPARSVSPGLHAQHRPTQDYNKKKSKVQKCAPPKFYTVPHNRIAEEGETIQFQCAINGHPLPWVTWDKDGCIVTPSNRIQIKERNELRILEISEVTHEDAGLYRITLENEYGRCEASARLDILKTKRQPGGTKSRISASPRRAISCSRRIMGNSTRIGGRLALACDFRGNSMPVTKFYHNGNELTETERVKINLAADGGQSRAILTIDDVRDCDAGVYTCIGENEWGLAASSTRWTPDDVGQSDDEYLIPEILTDLDGVIEWNEGSTLDLKFCIRIGTVPFEFVWMKDGTKITDSDDFRYIDHGNGLLCLRILDPFIGDSGRYSCCVISEYGSCQTSTMVRIAEAIHEPYRMPTFVKDPVSVVANHGAVISFCAKIEPFDANVKWFICGREVMENQRGMMIEHNQSDGTHILHILGIEYRHSGEVQCKAFIPSFSDHHEPQSFGAISAYTDLVVLPCVPQSNDTIVESLSIGSIPDASPAAVFDELSDQESAEILPADCLVNINRGPEDCTALIGGIVILTVEYDGYPEPTVNWLRAGRRIKEDENTQIHTTNGKTTLELRQITTDHSGKYTIELVNMHSSDMASASVAVEGPPEPPSGKPCVSAGTDRISVAWCGPPYDGGCMIIAFILEIEEDSGEWRELIKIADSLAYTFRNPKIGSHYRFRVRAENCHGLSEPSECSDKVLIAPMSNREQLNGGNDNRMMDMSDAKEISVKSGGDFKTRFEILEELGKGRFGVVYKVIERDTGQMLAAKIVKCIKAKDKEKIQDEIAIMNLLKHPKLLQLAASFEGPREMTMVMEYICGGELFERVVADDFTLTERDCVLFIRQICEGVDYMSSKSVVHLDLKPENIMCHNRTSHEIKIIDFGLAQRLDTTIPVRVLFGTPEFIPPEIINYEPIGFQSDMWSVGVICYVLLSGLSPFMGDSDVSTFSNITRADYDFDDDAFDAVSQDAKDFISSLLVSRKENRLTAKQCLASKWLNDFNDNLCNTKICTDKLKTFVIRRKWQKTGNAIRALGRMATLSANTRRNSAASTATTTPTMAAARTILSESSPTSVRKSSSDIRKEDSMAVILTTSTTPTINEEPTKLINKTKSNSCDERSDSGFSECSNCNGSAICTCAHPHFEKCFSITEENHDDDDDDDENQENKPIDKSPIHNGQNGGPNRLDHPIYKESRTLSRIPEDSDQITIGDIDMDLINNRQVIENTIPEVPAARHSIEQKKPEIIPRKKLNQTLTNLHNDEEIDFSSSNLGNFTNETQPPNDSHSTNEKYSTNENHPTDEKHSTIEKHFTTENHRTEEKHSTSENHSKIESELYLQKINEKFDSIRINRTDVPSKRTSEIGNTIQMRKHSLELKTHREPSTVPMRPKSGSPLATATGTVSRLKERFSLAQANDFQQTTKSASMTARSSMTLPRNTKLSVSTKPNQLRMELKDVFERVSPNTPTPPPSSSSTTTATTTPTFATIKTNNINNNNNDNNNSHSSLAIASATNVNDFNFNRNSNFTVCTAATTTATTSTDNVITRTPKSLMGCVKKATERLTNQSEKPIAKTNPYALQRSGTLPKMKSDNFKLATAFWKN